MITEKHGKIIKGLGGLYNVRVQNADGGVQIYTCRAKGVLHKNEEKLYIGDNVSVTVDDETPDGIVISDVDERKNTLIRPPMANLDYLFIVFAAKKPMPVLEVVDKLIAIAIHNAIVPVVVVTKQDLSDSLAIEYAEIYRKAGIETFVTSPSDDSDRLFWTEQDRPGEELAGADEEEERPQQLWPYHRSSQRRRKQNKVSCNRFQA